MIQQLNLFAPNLNVTARLKAAMREAIRKCQLSREEIVEAMRRVSRQDGLEAARGQTISLPNLDAWVAESKPNLIPVSLLTIFCCVTKDITPLQILAAPLNATVIGQEKLKILAWAELEVQARKLVRQKNKLLSEINGEGQG